MANPPLPPNRYITTHDPSTGAAIFSSVFPESLKVDTLFDGKMQFIESYKTSSFPVTLTSETDIQELQARSNDPPGITYEKGGTVLRYCDWAPGFELGMHRHETMDYGIVISGQVELILDSGEVRTLRSGDCMVQRGTMHAWRNPSSTEWARVVFILQGCPPVKVAGKTMAEHIPM
ncbi:hypothetical protein QBC46DRAFT_432348 [Diplogelasinospora grovesii]|uniref:Cupin type-2 domain-containing protein n=1 Tax=Diplogelasinospora grovesii TaxID=303347 RepID=A0AAN6MV68_9PEZI|nr:hypothetical protein QBC46DRAFT_432348 [Diplogelasinospora grovesii]